MSSYRSFDESRSKNTQLEIAGSSQSSHLYPRAQHATQQLQSVMNTSVTHDPEINSILLSNSTNLTNNYAPLEKVIIDTNFKRNTHPLASYLNDIPFYNDSFYNTTHISALARAQGQAIINSKFKNNEIKLDIPRLNAKNSKYDDNILTQTGFTDKRPRDANGFATSLRTQQANESAIKNVMYAKSDVIDDNKRYLVRTQELQHRYPISNDALVEKVETPASQVKEGFDNNENKKSIKPLRIKATSKRESFTRENDDDSYLDQVYIQSLESRIIAIIHYVLNNEVYASWKANWEALDKTLKKRDFNFSRLTCSDADIAYTVNKGEMTKFRIRDNDRKYVPLNIYQYVLLHECAHIANFNNWGHGADFQRLLSLLCLAAYELGLIRLKTMTKTVYLSNGQPIVCQRDMKNEILHGINEVVIVNPELKPHYNALIKHIESQ